MVEQRMQRFRQLLLDIVAVAGDIVEAPSKLLTAFDPKPNL